MRYWEQVKTDRAIAEYQYKKAQRAVKAARSTTTRNLVGAAFWVGWEIGDFLFPQGWYTFGNEASSPPQFGYYPGTGWFPHVHHSVHWDWHECSGGTATAWRVHGSSPTTCPAVPGGSATINVADPADIPDAYWYPGSTLPFPGAINSFTALNGTTNIGSFDFSIDGGGANEPQPEGYYTPGTGVVSAPLTGPFPSEAPMSFPLEWPMHFPTPTPWKDAGPRPGEQAPARDRGGSVVPAMPLAPFPVVVVNPPPGGGVPPPVQVVTVTPPPGGGGGQPPDVTIHTRPPTGNRPPARKTKEKKLSVRSKANKAWIVLNLATEVFDFIDALYKGLPKDVQKAIEATIDYGREGGGKADPYAKLKAVWDHWDEMNWDDAMQAFINNQIEDMVVGGIGAVATRANTVSGAATGGGGAVSGRPQSLASDAQEADGREADQLPIPTVDYNPETGRWEVTVPLSKAGLGDDLTFT